MIRINDLSVMQKFAETVPGAAGMGQEYLRAVSKGVVACQPPVTLSIDDMIQARGFRNKPIEDCLVATPTDKRIKKYPIVHFAVDQGGNLNVGWYQLGGDHAGGHDVGNAGFLTIRTLSDLDAEQLESIHTLMHQYAVLPAIQYLANQSQAGSGGFFNV